VRALVRGQVLRIESGALVGCEQEAGGPRGRVQHLVVGGRPDAVDHRRDQRSWGEVLSGAGLDVLGALGEQLLVGVALDVDTGGGPVLLVDQVDDESLELGRVLDPVLRVAEGGPEGALLPAEVLQDVPVGDLEGVPVRVEQLLPGELLRDDPVRVQRSVRPLVGHLEEQQIGQLLDVLDGGDPVVTEQVAVRPQLVDEPPRVGDGVGRAG